MCLLVVVYSKQVDMERSSDIQQKIKDQLVENIEDTKSVVNHFFSNIFELPSLQALCNQLAGWIAGVLIASIFAQIA